MANVKIGDIARVVNSGRNNGMLVIVKRLDCDFLGPARLLGVDWECEALQSFFGFKRFFEESGKTYPAGTQVTIPDEDLRRLHDGDGVDEVIRRVGKPADIRPAAPTVKQAETAT